jgi:hypothetical protein
MHMQRRRAAVEHAAERLAITVRDLGGTVQLKQVLGRVVAADGAAGLERHARVPAGFDIDLDYCMRIAEGGFDVAIAVAQNDCFCRTAGLELARRIAG